MSKQMRANQAEALKDRLIAHAKDGKTKLEACDIEGADPSTAAAALAGTGLKWRNDKGKSSPFVGSEDQFVRSFSYQLRSKIEEKLVAKYGPYEIARMTGVTKRQLKRMVANGQPHNWTLGQITRLAKALGLSPEALLVEVLKNRI